MRLLRRKKHVRLHLDDDKPSVEGILVGKVCGHYLIERPSIIPAENQTHRVDGTLEVPEWRVVYVQVLGVDGKP